MAHNDIPRDHVGFALVRGMNNRIPSGSGIRSASSRVVRNYDWLSRLWLSR